MVSYDKENRQDRVRDIREPRDDERQRRKSEDASQEEYREKEEQKESSLWDGAISLDTKFLGSPVKMSLHPRLGHHEQGGGHGGAISLATSEPDEQFQNELIGGL